MQPRSGEILAAAQVVASVMAPDGDTGFVGVVEHVPAIDGVARGKIVVDAGQIVVLRRSCRVRCRSEIESALLGIRLGHVLQESQGLRAERSARDDVVLNPDIQWIAQHDGLPRVALTNPLKSPLRVATEGIVRKAGAAA